MFTDDVIGAVITERGQLSPLLLNNFCCFQEQLVVPVKARFYPALALVQFIQVQKEKNNKECPVRQL